MNLFKKKSFWQSLQDDAEFIRQRVNDHPGMAEAKRIRDPIQRTETILDIAMSDMEMMRVLNAYLAQQTFRTNKICLAVLAISSMMDIMILAYHLGVIG